jgi:hypothetical protein
MFQSLPGLSRGGAFNETFPKSIPPYCSSPFSDLPNTRLPIVLRLSNAQNGSWCLRPRLAAGSVDGSIPLATQELVQLLAPYIKLPSTPREPPDLFSAFLQAAKALNRTQNHHTPKIAEDVPYSSFHFSVEVRTQCTKCLGVRYRTEEVDSLVLPACDEVNTSASAEEATCRALEIGCRKPTLISSAHVVKGRKGNCTFFSSASPVHPYLVR